MAIVAISNGSIVGMQIRRTRCKRACQGVRYGQPQLAMPGRPRAAERGSALLRGRPEGAGGLTFAARPGSADGRDEGRP